MIDQAVVVSTAGGLAEVEVSPKVACCECSARVFCRPEKGEPGRLTVMNPLGAARGDRVKIEVPEGIYTRQTMKLFGSLLIFLGLGLGMGVLAARIFPLPQEPAQFLGLTTGLILGGLVVWLAHGKRARRAPYPVIVGIDGGENHGQT